MPDSTIVPLIDLAERKRHAFHAIGDGEEDLAARSGDAGQLAQRLPFVGNMLEDRDRRGGPERSVGEGQPLRAAGDKEASVGDPLVAGKTRRGTHPLERNIAADRGETGSGGLDDGVGATSGTRVSEP